MDEQDINPHQWVDLYGDVLYSYAMKFIPRHDEAENLVQETFLAALRAKGSFKGQSSLQTWLISILRHKITDHLRQKYREVPVSALTPEDADINGFFDHAQEHLKKEPSYWEFHPDQLMENREFWQAFEECLKKLPERGAQAFALREIEQKKTNEICKDLNISSTNLWVLLHRARVQLRQCLEINWFKQ